MADILDYTENTALSDADAFYVVDDPTGTPLDQYSLLSTLHDNIRDGIDREVQIILIAANVDLSTGDGFSNVPFIVGSFINGYNLIDAQAIVNTASSSGTPTFQVYNVTQAADMLSTVITIDINEKTSYTAATPSVVDTANDDVAVGDELRFDCDVVGTGTKGVTIILRFEKP